MEFYEDIAPFVDLFLWDIKDTDPVRHKRWTGVSNERIIENLYRVDALGRTTRLRCLLIAGVNDNAAHARAVARLAGSLRCCHGIDVLPYHGCGKGKLESLGMLAPPEEFVAPEENRITEFRGWLRAEGLHAA
jgi:pyruvate formate lyase activating enzyme